jgi:CYTH domain-containing protein
MIAFLNKESDSLETYVECVNETDFSLNIKDIGTIKRNHIRINISQSEFEVMYAVSKPKVIHYTQYALNDSKNNLISLIKYDNINENIMVVEYHSDMISTQSYVPDPWFKNDVTNDYRYNPIFLSINKKIIGEKIIK